MAYTFVAENHFNPIQFNVDTADPTKFKSEIIDPGGDPVSVIHAGDAVQVQIDWEQTGQLFFLNLLANKVDPITLTPDPYVFKAKLFMEKMGPGADPPVVVSAPVTVIAATPQPYTTNIALPALTAGVYKLVVTLNLYDSDLAPAATPFHSFSEMGMVEVV